MPSTPYLCYLHDLAVMTRLAEFERSHQVLADGDQAAAIPIPGEP